MTYRGPKSIDILRQVFVISRQSWSGGDPLGTVIRATALWGYRDLMRELGGDPDAYLSRFGIPRDIERREDAFIGFEAYLRLLEASADELNCPDFGLRLSHWQGLDVLGPVAVIARNAQTVLGGLESIAQFLYVHSPALTLTLVPRTADPTVRFTFQMTDRGLPENIQSYEITMAVARRIVRLLGGPHARLSAVSFLHDQHGPDAAYRDALGCPVRFKQSWCGFELSAGLADRRIEAADPEAARIAAKYLDSNYLPPATTLAERAAELTRRLLPTGHCTVDVIAGEFAMHPRTLQRRLAAEGTRCQDVIDRERRLQAARYLAESGLELNQVTGLLGYTEQSTLNRSCRRWFGKTPHQYRAELT